MTPLFFEEVLLSLLSRHLKVSLGYTLRGQLDVFRPSLLLWSSTLATSFCKETSPATRKDSDSWAEAIGTHCWATPSRWSVEHSGLVSTHEQFLAGTILGKEPTYGRAVEWTFETFSSILCGSAGVAAFLALEYSIARCYLIQRTKCIKAHWLLYFRWQEHIVFWSKICHFYRTACLSYKLQPAFRRRTQSHWYDGLVQFRLWVETSLAQPRRPKDSNKNTFLSTAIM